MKSKRLRVRRVPIDEIDVELKRADDGQVARIEDQGDDGEIRLRDTQSRVLHHPGLMKLRRENRPRKKKL